MINKVILVGRLGQDPKVRYTKTGSAVTNVSVATNRSWKDKEGNWQDETEWHKVILFGEQAERCSKNFAKGNFVYVEGRSATKKWQDQNGNDRYTTEVIANVFRNLSPKSDSDSQPEQNSNQKNANSGTGEDVPF